MYNVIIFFTDLPGRHKQVGKFILDVILLSHVGLNDPRTTGRVAAALGEAAYKQAYEISIGYLSRAPTGYNKTAK